MQLSQSYIGDGDKMPDPSEIGAGMGQRDFVPTERLGTVTPKPGRCHVKVTCQHCGNLLGHFRIEGDLHFIPLEVEPCQECLTGAYINQQVRRLGDED